LNPPFYWRKPIVHTEPLLMLDSALCTNVLVSYEISGSNWMHAVSDK
jgi:hypothetical protein